MSPSIEPAEFSDFLRSLESVTHTEPISPGVPLFDLGLIILEPESNASFDTLAHKVPALRRHDFALTDHSDYLQFATALTEANNRGIWLVVDCQADPSPTVITILKQLAEDNACTISNFDGQELTRVTLNAETRLLFIIPRLVLEEIITYPYFSNLFGPVLRIAS